MSRNSVQLEVMQDTRKYNKCSSLVSRYEKEAGVFDISTSKAMVKIKNTHTSACRVQNGITLRNAHMFMLKILNDSNLKGVKFAVYFTFAGVPGLAVVVLLKTLEGVGEFPSLVVVVLPKLNLDFFSAGFSI